MASLFKTLILLTALALGGVDARRSNASLTLFASNSSSTAAPSPLLRSAPVTCLRREPENGEICMREGTVVDETDSLNQPYSWILTRKACADECARFEGFGKTCTAFSFQERVGCQLFNGDFSARGFSDSYSSIVWYQRECWTCTNQAILDLDFERATAASDWKIGIDDSNAFEFDVMEVDSVTDPTTFSDALVVSEKTSEHVAGRLDCQQGFNLESGKTYKIVFSAMTSYKGDDFDWGRLTLVVWNEKKILFQSPPANGVDLGKGWSRFKLTFEIDEGQEGVAGLSMWFWTSEKSADWIIDDLYIEDALY
ncbi:hypothetical protein G7Z17_g94 [Cylindrodendrum hubeiense]|uniref:Apple domain-containing protein n=1 Tax=Cylindrodendrum hubeiense TaxID=595255 RepID=A0A9P5LNJ1_9HYPO|nr:hypothetical protein G7Z17_g94 [Cylindrodendrum hubeiense]